MRRFYPWTIVSSLFIGLFFPAVLIRIAEWTDARRRQRTLPKPFPIDRASLGR